MSYFIGTGKSAWVLEQDDMKMDWKGEWRQKNQRGYCNKPRGEVDKDKCCKKAGFKRHFGGKIDRIWYKVDSAVCNSDTGLKGEISERGKCKRQSRPGKYGRGCHFHPEAQILAKRTHGMYL